MRWRRMNYLCWEIRGWKKWSQRSHSSARRSEFTLKRVCATYWHDAMEEERAQNKFATAAAAALAIQVSVLVFSVQVFVAVVVPLESTAAAACGEPAYDDEC